MSQMGFNSNIYNISSKFPEKFSSLYKCSANFARPGRDEI